MSGLVSYCHFIMSNHKKVRDNPPSGYELADVHLGYPVRVFLNTGSVLSGTLTRRAGKSIHVKETYRERPAFINLDSVSSIV
jgi:hypothetical protein